jgi:hypothetical protein
VRARTKLLGWQPSSSHFSVRTSRQVMPNLVVFDAGGVAGSAAGEGTPWLSSFFEQRKSAGGSAPSN